jgi:two-component system cell cycle response regulator
LSQRCFLSEWTRSKRYSRPLALLMLDIDLFKSVNDRYGHDAGDEVIKSVADVLKTKKRAFDVAGRLGGEEFALLLPEATLDNACAAAERLRQVVADRAITVKENRISITISIGASIAQGEMNGVADLIKQADVALYEAKPLGPQPRLPVRAGRSLLTASDPPKDRDERRIGAP